MVSYRVQYRKQQHASFRVVEVPTASTQSYLIEGLDAGQKYEVRVLAATAVGYPKISDEARWPWTPFHMPTADSRGSEGGGVTGEGRRGNGQPELQLQVEPRHGPDRRARLREA